MGPHTPPPQMYSPNSLLWASHVAVSLFFRGCPHKKSTTVFWVFVRAPGVWKLPCGPQPLHISGSVCQEGQLKWIAKASSAAFLLDSPEMSSRMDPKDLETTQQPAQALRTWVQHTCGRCPSHVHITCIAQASRASRAQVIKRRCLGNVPGMSRGQSSLRKGNALLWTKSTLSSPIASTTTVEYVLFQIPSRPPLGLDCKQGESGGSACGRNLACPDLDDRW